MIRQKMKEMQSSPGLNELPKISSTDETRNMKYKLMATMTAHDNNCLYLIDENGKNKTIELEKGTMKLKHCWDDDLITFDNARFFSQNGKIYMFSTGVIDNSTEWSILHMNLEEMSFSAKFPAALIATGMWNSITTFELIEGADGNIFIAKQEANGDLTILQIPDLEQYS